MENEIVERVARALEPSAFATYDLGYTQQNSHDLRAFLNAERAVRRARRKARIAIAAMREPMLATARARAAIYETIARDRDPLAPDDTNPHDRSAFGVEVVDRVEQDLAAMIDAALAPAP